MRYIRCYNTKEECNENEYVENESGDVTCLTKLDPEVVYVRNIEETLYNCLQPGPTPPVDDFTISFYGVTPSNDRTETFTFNTRTVSCETLMDSIMGATLTLLPQANTFIFYEDKGDDEFVELYTKGLPTEQQSNCPDVADFFFGPLGWDASDSTFPQSLNGKTFAINAYIRSDSK